MALTAGPGATAAGYHAWVARRDTVGYPKGTLATPDTPVNGTVYGAYKLNDVISATSPTMDRIIATFRAGQKFKGNRVIGVQDATPFDLVLDTFDEVFHSYITGAVADVATMSGAVLSAPNSGNASPPQFVLGVVTGFQERSTGTNYFMTLIYPNVQFRAPWMNVSQQGGENPGALTYQVIPTISTHTGIGRLYSGTALAVTDNKDVAFAMRGLHPYMVATYVDDGSTGSFTLPYLPTSALATGADTNSIAKNGTTLAVTSVSITTGVVTQTAAATGGDIIVVAYQTDFATA
jgi:hypothetical protein